MGYSPAMLNRLVPDLTPQLVSKIFATDLEDWPAVLRAMHQTGDELVSNAGPRLPPPMQRPLRKAA